MDQVWATVTISIQVAVHRHHLLVMDAVNNALSCLRLVDLQLGQEGVFQGGTPRSVSRDKRQSPMECQSALQDRIRGSVQQEEDGLAR